MEKEIWLPIEGYEIAYEVSSFGRVRSHGHMVRRGPGNGLWFLKPRILKQVMTKGRPMVILYKDQKRTRFLISRLVAAAFLEMGDFNVVNHIDFNPENNCVWNLEWTDCAGNVEHSRKAGHYSAFHRPKRRFKLDPKKVKGILKMHNAGAKGVAIARRYKISTAMTSLIINRKIWKEV